MRRTLSRIRLVIRLRKVRPAYPAWRMWVSRGDSKSTPWVYAVTADGLRPGDQATVFAPTPELIGGEIEAFEWQRERVRAAA